MENKKGVNLVYTNIQHIPRKKLGLSLTEYVLCDMIYHLSNNPKYNWCIMSKENMGNEIGISKRQVLNLVKNLIIKGLIIKDEDTKFLKTSSLWYNSVVIYDSEIIAQQVNNQDTSGEIIAQDKGNNCTPSGEIIAHNNNINNNTKDNKYIEILDFWNSLGIIKHDKTPDDYEKILDKKLKKYSIDEVKQTLQKYADIVLGKDYWFNYKWTLRDFLGRKNGFDTFYDTPKENYKNGHSIYSNTPSNALKDEIDLGDVSFSESVSVDDFFNSN